MVVLEPLGSVKTEYIPVWRVQPRMSVGYRCCRHVQWFPSSLPPRGLLLVRRAPMYIQRKASAAGRWRRKGRFGSWGWFSLLGLLLSYSHPVFQFSSSLLFSTSAFSPVALLMLPSRSSSVAIVWVSSAGCSYFFFILFFLNGLMIPQVQAFSC